MKKAATLIIFLLIYPALYVSASYIEVTFFSFNPEEPQPGESVALNIRLANKNYDQDFDVTCRLFIDSEIHDVKVVPVTRRSSSGVTFTWTAEPGNHLFSLEMSYYVDRNEETDTFFKNLDVPGGEEEIDYFSEAVRLFDSQSYVQAKIFFEQAKRRFEETQNMDQALACEEYISQCDDYIEANQKFQQAAEARGQGDLYTAIALYQQAQVAYEALNDSRALLCGEKIEEIEKIQEEQRRKANLPYYLGLLLMPVAAGLIAFVWLKRKGPPKPAPPLPQYVPEQKVKGLFRDSAPEPEIVKELHTIESRLDTKDPETFKSAVEDFKKKEQTFDKKEYHPEEAEYIKESMETVKQEIKDKGRQLQDIQKLKELKKRCTKLLDEPVGDLVDAYNRYAQLHNAFDQIPDYNIPEQEEVRAKLKDYYTFIQQQAKSKQSER